MASMEVTLVHTRDEEGTRSVWARMTPEGILVIEGQDLGPGVSAFFGPSNTEYEYEVTVVTENLPRLMQLLGAAPGVWVLDALAARFSGQEAHKLRTFLEQNGLAGPGWTRIGE
jgi:hypothetical protein